MDLQQAWEHINRINDEAHEYAYDLWVAADEMDDPEEAEDQRCEASAEQAMYFADLYDRFTSKEDKLDIEAHCLTNEDFKDQFECYMGWV